MRASDLPGALVSGFLAVFFLSAGLDRLLDRKTNLMKYRVRFDSTPMRRPAGVWLSLLTLGELITGIVLAAGCLTLVLARQPGMATVGAIFGAMTLIFFFFGVRLGRDDQSATRTVPYFLTCVAALALLGR